MAETTLEDLGHGTIAKYTLDANISTSVNISEAVSWELKATGVTGTDTIKSSEKNIKWVENGEGKIVVFIDTTVTGIGEVTGRLSMIVSDTDYPGKLMDDVMISVNERPEVTTPFKMFNVK